MAFLPLGWASLERVSRSERRSNIINCVISTGSADRTSRRAGSRLTPPANGRWDRMLGIAVVLSVCVFAIGCGSSSIDALLSNPKVEFTNVPLAGADNPGKISPIEGRVQGAQPGQQIVIYAKGETKWWVQPLADHPFTKIERNSTWSNTTHPGTAYAALLVGSDFRPPPTADELPTEGVLASAISKGGLAFWRRWWFLPGCAVLSAVLIFGIHRIRVHQMSRKLHLRFEERLAERTRVAQELHDTLLQGVLSASMQLHVAVDQLPEDSPARPGLNRVLQLMGQVVDEGRNTLRGLRSHSNKASDLENSFSRVPQELGSHPGIEFRVIVEGLAVPLCSVIRDDVYSIGREALVNAFRHSRARKVDVELEYDPSHLRVLIRDDGCGIDAHMLQTGRDGHWGLSGMRERAERIGARFKVLSRPGSGTEVELSVPGDIAFESSSTSTASKRFAGFHQQPAKQNASSQSKE